MSIEIKKYLTAYSTNNIDEASSTITYIGKEDRDGNWIVMKIDTSSGTSISYATKINNSSYADYSSAWAARTSLTYENYSQAF